MLKNVSCEYDRVVSITYGATQAGRIMFDTKRKRENSHVWPFEARMMLLLDRSRV